MHKEWKRWKDVHTLDMLIKHFTEVWFGNCRLWYGILINTILADLGDKMTHLFLLSLLRKKDIFQFLLQDAKIKPQWHITSHLLGWLLPKRQKTISIGEDVKKLEPLYTVDGNAKWCSHYRKQYRSSSKY